MCAPRVTRHTSIRSIFAFLPRVTIGTSIFFTVAMIRAFRSARWHGNGGTNTFACFARNARCTVTTDYPGVVIFSLHTFAPLSGRNVNYDEKNLLGKNF